MGESLYHLLGVDRNADDAAIRRAYRKRIKEHHPDVSDDPDAVDEFKRLTAARDVLMDDRCRARYERMGHDAYVVAELETELWADPDDRSETTDTATSSPNATDARHTSRTEGRSARATRSAAQSRATGTSPTAARGFQAHSAWTRNRYRSPSVRPEPATPFDRIRESLRSLGPWVVVHAVFLVTAAAVAGLLTVSIGSVSALTLPLGAGFFGLALFLSALHVVSVLYV